jgi:hypothetical protein
MNKWGYKHKDDELYGVLFISRNKDNKDVQNFKPRRMAFTINDFEKIYERKFQNEFLAFRDSGVQGEFVRAYITVNSRDVDKTRKALICAMVNDEDVSLSHIQAKVCALSMEKGMNATKRWMFDVDTKDYEFVKQFIHELEEDYGFLKADTLDDFMKSDPTIEGMYFKQVSPNGYAILVNKGFDTRNILKDREDVVTLKRDDMIIIDWDRKA